MPRTPKPRTNAKPQRTKAPDTRARPKEPRTGKTNGGGRKPEDEVRYRAFEIFERRGGEPGREVEDWLAAEEELGIAKRRR